MQASNHVNPYQVLNISPDASIADIKKRYHELILECHPDKVNASSDVAFKERVLQQYLQIQASWSLLSDPQQRQRFDAQLAGMLSKWYIYFALIHHILLFTHDSYIIYAY